MYSWLLLIFTLHGSVFGAIDITDCDSNKCYQTVNNSYKNLLDLINRLNSTTSQAKIPKIYDRQQIINDIKKVKEIENEFKRIKDLIEKSAEELSQTENTIGNDQDIVDRMLEKLANITEYNSTADKIIKEANEYLQNFEKSLEFGENASKTCQQAHDNYADFKKIIDQVIKDYDNVSQSYDDANERTKELNEDIINTFQETVNDKNDFDELKLPINLVKDYFFKTESSFNETVHRLKENVDLLKELLGASQKKWNDQLREKAEDVEKYIDEIQDDVNDMTEDLKKYEGAFADTDTFEPTVNAESRRLLDEIKRKLTRVENDFKRIDFSDEEKRLLLSTANDDERQLEEITRKRLLIKEYNVILDAIPTDETKLQEIREQIITLRNTIALIEEWKDLNDQLRRLRMNRDAVLDINCTAIAQNNNSGLLT